MTIKDGHVTDGFTGFFFCNTASDQAGDCGA
jgi:hypothetical protein